jgi:hypothetical protein
MTLRPCWYHGKETRDGLWQVDAAHPGVWLSSTRVSARWYAGNTGMIVTAELQTTDVLDLRDKKAFTETLRRAFPGGPLTQIRKSHASGNLYLLEDGVIQNAVVAEVLRTHAGVVLRDETDGKSHLSLVVRGPEVLKVRSERVLASSSCNWSA